jgi:hypothetical protein
MANFMPLVHQARRTIGNRQDGNPFATDAVIADLIEALGHRLPRGAGRARLPRNQSGAGPPRNPDLSRAGSQTCPARLRPPGLGVLGERWCSPMMEVIP